MPSSTPYPVLDDQLHADITRAAKLYSPDAVLVIEKGTEFCPHCHFWIPTRDQQLVRHHIIDCQNCGQKLGPAERTPR